MNDEKKDLLYKDIKQVRQGSIKFSKRYKAKLILSHVANAIAIILLILAVSYVGYRIADNSIPTPDGRVSYTEVVKDARVGDQIILYRDKYTENDSFEFINKILSHIGVQDIEVAKIIATPQTMLLPDNNGNNIILSNSQFFVEFSNGSRNIIETDIVLGIVKN